MPWCFLCTVMTAGPSAYGGTYSFESHNHCSDDEGQYGSECCHTQGNKDETVDVVPALFPGVALCEGKKRREVKPITKSVSQVFYFYIYEWTVPV